MEDWNSGVMDEDAFLSLFQGRGQVGERNKKCSLRRECAIKILKVNSREGGRLCGTNLLRTVRAPR
jgi:hypothetical protein